MGLEHFGVLSSVKALFATPSILLTPRTVPYLCQQMSNAKIKPPNQSEGIQHIEEVM